MVSSPSHPAPRTFFYFLHSLLTTMRESPGTGIYIRRMKKQHQTNKQTTTATNKTKQQQTRDIENKTSLQILILPRKRQMH